MPQRYLMTIQLVHQMERGLGQLRERLLEAYVCGIVPQVGSKNVKSQFIMLWILKLALLSPALQFLFWNTDYHFQTS